MPARLAFSLALVLCVGCSGSGDDGVDGGAVDASGPPPDASAQCVATSDVEVGVCQLADDSPCTGASDPGQRFVALAEGGTVPTVVGFQGLGMFALGIRTRGIEPGDPNVPEGLPAVDFGLFDENGQIVASYQRDVAFMAVAGDAGLYEMLSVYLVVGSGPELVGKALKVTGTVVDASGTTKCGTRNFIGAAL